MGTYRYGMIGDTIYERDTGIIILEILYIYIYIVMKREIGIGTICVGLIIHRSNGAIKKDKFLT